MIVPDRTYRCELCGSQQALELILELTYGTGEAVVRSVLCLDGNHCGIMQTKPPTDVIPVSQTVRTPPEEDVPF